LIPDTAGVAIDLCALSNNTSPKISPINASNPNKANNRGVQHVFFYLVGGITGAGIIFAV